MLNQNPPDPSIVAFFAEKFRTHGSRKAIHVRSMCERLGVPLQAYAEAVLEDSPGQTLQQVADRHLIDNPPDRTIRPAVASVRPIHRKAVSRPLALVELSECKLGSRPMTRTIQILRAGQFTDMNGKDVDVTAADLTDYVRNSNTLLAAEDVPIEVGHPQDPGAPAAAWYRRFFKQTMNGVDWICAEVELSTLGMQSLADKLYKYFSADLDLAQKTIVGGGFVNRPAVGGQQALGRHRSI